MTGSELIANERRRQVEEKGWTTAYDDRHLKGELALAAVCYASPELLYIKQTYANGVFYGDPWPWKRDGSPATIALPNDQLPMDERIDLLVKSGALIAAEIDRLQRLHKKA